PPRKPVITNNCSSGETAWKFRNRPMAIPISRPPVRLAASVPSGTVGNSGLNRVPSPQRHQQPMAPPTPIATNPLTPTSASPLNEKCPVAAAAGRPAPPETGDAGIINLDVDRTGGGLSRDSRLRNGRHAISHVGIVVDRPAFASSAAIYCLPRCRYCRHEPSPAPRTTQPAMAARRAVDDRAVLDRRGVSVVPVDRLALRGGRRGIAADDQRVPDHVCRDEPVPRRDL